MSVLTNWTFRQAPYQQQQSQSLLYSSFLREAWYNATPERHSHQIHIDLMYNDLIPDPFVNDNELNISWVSDLTWEYRCLFDVSVSQRQAYLVFDQLDTEAEVELNNEVIAQSDNAFHKHVVAVNLTLKNDLIVKLKSGVELGKKLENEFGRCECWNGDCSRVYVRKPQFQYGWDWGPKLITCGFGKIELVTENYVDDLFIRYKLNEALDQAHLWFEVESILFTPVVRATIEISLGEEVIDVIELDQVDPQMNISYVLEDVQLWWPIKHGKPNLYNIKLFYKDKLMSCKFIGFRKIELVTTPDDYGSSFYFKINDKPIQMIGSNWIPSHSFISQVTKQDYQEYVDLIIDSNQNMIRVWGGGHYESDEFYQLCDLYGIIIWQDFMFACGIYPYEPILQSVQEEIKNQVKRLRNFASIVFYVGNNEDYQIADALKLDKNNVSQFPAKPIYEDIIPVVLTTFANQVAYRFGSPYSDDVHSSYDLRFGDSHQWDVWHGRRLPYQAWPQLSARFISEFGMLSLPEYSTLSKYITGENQLYPDSNLINFHTKPINKGNLGYYIWSNFNKPESLNLQDWIYLTQLMQSEAVSLAFRYWRRQWNQFQCGGVLVWQLNDCWPSVSWSVVDFEKVPKLSYYGMKRELKEVSVAGYRAEEEEEEEEKGGVFAGQTVFQESRVKFDMWGFGNVCNLTLIVEFYNSDGDFVDEYKQNGIDFEGNKVNTIMSGATFDQLKKNTIVYLKLSKDNIMVARSSDWPQPLKKLNWEKLTSNLQIDIEYQGSGQFQLSTNKPVKALQLYFESARRYRFSDNGIDLFPGDPQVIQVIDLQEEEIDKIKYRYLNY
ncbi:late-stage biofilm-induced gene in C. albicans [Candida orthopsilosis Co 90-125]|uniref:beta-mannosidase n=1 Tax=Candida orthopsilosis (strain 90-125) TaxID=1136231 RepID=H8WVN7_CANO9|nr:late-stage biofilm-induced gene in C. albicans [Candida orthopsilosis Co 90-125]CCG20510.1 late-stage biofilm-induced gene in C. albicans [Candida orthopsilosis Co 90-125]